MIKNFIILIVVLLSSIFLPSCDECSTLDCENSIGCEEGICICEEGYEGTTCKNKANHKFLGAYNGRENCNNNSKELEISHLVSGQKPYEVTIVFSSNSVKATVKETTIDIIEQDVIFNGDSVHIFPTNGKLSGKQLVFSIHSKASNNIEQTCVYNFTKKK